MLSVDRSGRGILLLLRRSGSSKGRGQLKGGSFSRRPASTVVLGRITFKAPVAAAAFSPCGRYLAVAVGRLVQVWTTPLSASSSSSSPPSSADGTSPPPAQAKVPSPLALHRTFGHCSGEVTCLCWSPCGHWLAGGSRDLTVRVWSLDPIRFPENDAANASNSKPKKWRTVRFVPPTLAAHKEPPVAVCFAEGASAQAPLGGAGGGAPSHPAPALYSLSRDGTLCVWCFDKEEEGGIDPVAAAAAAAWGDDDEEDEDDNEHDEMEEGEEEEREGEGEEDEDEDGEARRKRARPSSSSGANASNPPPASSRSLADRHRFARGVWRLGAKHYFNQRGAKITCASFHARAGLLAAGLSSGAFDLRELPSFAPLHALSASRAPLTSLCFSEDGEWLAVGAAALGQLVVWDWRSEVYVFRQAGHASASALAASSNSSASLGLGDAGPGVSALAFSTDAAGGNGGCGALATGGTDGDVRLWDPAAGTCHATLKGHAAAVTGVAYLPGSAGALVSSSLDGTVRAWDLARYRCFRTLVPPERAQLSCLASDAGGDVVAAGTAGSAGAVGSSVSGGGASSAFQVVVWSVRTARVLDVLSGHEGPVSCAAFAPAAASAGAAPASTLATGSWDKTVRTWDVFGGKGALESLPHAADVLALAWHPDGRSLASSTADGIITFWDPAEATVVGTIEGRRDLGRPSAAGALVGGSLAAAAASFSSLSFSADGATLVAGGASRFVCLYDVAEKVLLRRLSLSADVSRPGVLDGLPGGAGGGVRRGETARLTAAGVAVSELPSDADDDDDEAILGKGNCGARKGKGGGNASLPGTTCGGGGKNSPPPVRATALALSATGRHLAVASPADGVLLFSDDPGATFDPGDLGPDVTPAAVDAALAARAPLRACRLALRLGDRDLLKKCLLAVRPGADVRAAASGIPASSAPEVLAALADLLSGETPHAEFCVSWARALLRAHARALRDAPRGATAPPLRALQAAAARLQADLGAAAAANVHTLKYLSRTAPTKEEARKKKKKRGGKEVVKVPGTPVRI